MLPPPTLFTCDQMHSVLKKVIEADGKLSLNETLNHDNSWINDFFSLIDFDDIQRRQHALENAQHFILESVLKAKSTGSDSFYSGKISCEINIGHSRFIVSETWNALEITDYTFSSQKMISNIITGKKFSDLKRVMLMQYLAIERKKMTDHNQMIDVSHFNFHDVDLNGIDLLNLVFGPENTSALATSHLLTYGMSADKNLLCALVKAGKNVQGMVLRRQNLDGIDLSGVDLSGAIFIDSSLIGAKLIGANFTYAIFKNTCLDQANLKDADFTGVNLKTCSLQSAYYCDMVIVGEPDRISHIIRAKSRLLFILDGNKSDADKDFLLNVDDIFYKLAVKTKNEIREGILFNLTEKSLLSGKTADDGGPQSMYIDNKVDRRLIRVQSAGSAELGSSVSMSGIEEMMINLFPRINDPLNNPLIKTNLLFAQEFTVAQKTLFHQARSAVHSMLMFDNYLYSSGLISETIAINLNKLSSIYIEGRPNGSRLCCSLMKVCFDTILPFVRRQFPVISEVEIAQVRNLFESDRYKW